MILVTTTGGGSLDRYSQELASRLDVPKLETDVYQSIAEQFNIPLASPAAVRALTGDIGFIRQLRSIDQPVHLPNHHLGRYGRFLAVPYVITVHDLIRYFDMHRHRPFIHHPNFRDRLYLRMDVLGIRKAAAIIAVSNTTKYDLIEHLGIPEERIHVIYEAVDHAQFHPVEACPTDFPYILFVGSEHPRKNLSTLFAAFAELKRSGRYPDLKLVKIGKAGGAEARFRDHTLRQLRRLGIESDVVLTGHVTPDELTAYYSHALATVMPSLYEGFGLPTIEAMACGSPVVVSSAGSLPEIAGDAAVIVSPHDVTGLARALQSLIDDERLRAHLRERGLHRAADFDWGRMAQETAQIYREVEERMPRPAADIPAIAHPGVAG